MHFGRLGRRIELTSGGRRDRLFDDCIFNLLFACVIVGNLFSRCRRRLELHRVRLNLGRFGRRSEPSPNDVPNGLEAAFAGFVGRGGEDVAREVTEECSEHVINSLEDARVGGVQGRRGREADQGREEERERREQEVRDVGDERREQAVGKCSKGQLRTGGNSGKKTQTYSRIVSPHSSTSFDGPERVWQITSTSCRR